VVVEQVLQEILQQHKQLMVQQILAAVVAEDQHLEELAAQVVLAS
jgi:hypothetical protein